MSDGPAAPRPLAADNLRGALWMLVSVAGATGMTLCVRALSPELAAGMIAFLRSVLGLVFVAPRLVRGPALGFAGLTRPDLHLARGALIAVALNAGFYAIHRLPMATATILFFLAPVFSTLLAPALIGERVGPSRVAAVGAGFLGALVVLRPGVVPVDLGAMAAVLSSACFALALLIGKTASRADGPEAVFASTAVLSAAFTLPFALPVWEVPGAPWVWATLAALTACSSLRSLGDIRAMTWGEAGFVAPVSYLRLPAVALAGWIWFGETVDLWTWIGGAGIAAAALALALRERRWPAG